MLNPIRNVQAAHIEFTFSIALLLFLVAVSVTVSAWKKFVSCVKDSIFWPIIRQFLG